MPRLAGIVCSRQFEVLGWIFMAAGYAVDGGGSWFPWIHHIFFHLNSKLWGSSIIYVVADLVSRRCSLTDGDGKNQKPWFVNVCHLKSACFHLPWKFIHRTFSWALPGRWSREDRWFHPDLCETFPSATEACDQLAPQRPIRDFISHPESIIETLGATHWGNPLGQPMKLRNLEVHHFWACQSCHLRRFNRRCVK